jgi:Na+/melibiose symporter-like transporter
MADLDYAIDDEGNLVERSAPELDSDVAESAEEVTPEARRRFLAAVLASDVLGVLVLAGAALLLPESRTILLILAVVYAIVSIPVFAWLSRSTRQKVEESQRRYASS